MTHHLVGSAEAARILGVTRQRVAQLAVTDGFPSPEVELTGGRIWSRHAIEAWAAAHQDRAGARGSDGDQGDEGWAMHRVQKLAGEESAALGHSHVGVEHAVLAMVRRECPGVARQVLESFGVALESLRARVVELVGPAQEGVTARSYTPRLQVMLERAKLEAERLADDVVNSHHLLLAIVDDESGWARALLESEIPAEWVRQRVIALTDVPAAADPPDPEYLRRKAKSRRAREATDAHVLPSYRTRSDGVDPRDRRPWGSVGWMGEPWRTPDMPVQYTVDRDGVPVLGPTGRVFCSKTDEEGFMVVGDDGKLIEEEFDLPDGAVVTWPEGFEPPPGADPQLVSLVSATRSREKRD